MARKRSLLDDEIEQIAVLHAEHGMKQAVIAETLGVSPATISRAINVGLEKGILVRRLETTDRIDGDNRLKVNRLRKIEPLERRLRTLEERALSKRRSGRLCFKELQVFESGEKSNGSAKADYAERVQRFSIPLAGFLARRIETNRPKSLGVSWGAALHSLSSAMKGRISTTVRSGAPMLCVPIAGAPPDAELDEETSAAHLAGEFSRLLNAVATESHSFSAGAWVPAEFSKKEVDVIRRFCFSSPAYRAVFGEDGIADNLSCILTSVGAMANFAGPWLQGAATASSRLSDKEFSKLAAGNISGCFLPRENIDTKGRKVIEQINQRWLGIRLHQLEACAMASATKDTLGVIVIAVGVRKAEVVLEAIKLGIVNTLCIDEHLMHRLEEITAETKP